MISISHLKVVSSCSRFIRKQLNKHKATLLTVPSITAVIIGLNYTGIFQSLELGVLDQFFRLRPPESKEERIVIVTVDDIDIEKIKQWPISDQIMAKVLKRIVAQKPIAIGLDIYRDIPVPPGHEELIELFNSSANIIGVEKVVEKVVNPSPTLKQLDQVGFADLVLDQDGKIRRALLSIKRDNGDIQLSLATYLALIYLSEKGIHLTPVNSDDSKNTISSQLQAGYATFSPLKDDDGGYVDADFGGYQILLNYRGTESSFITVPLRDVLDNKISPDLMSDKLVFIGITAASINDNFFPPYSNNLGNSPRQTPGVIIHANIASQIISAALDGRNLIKIVPESLEYFWILICCFVAFKAIFSLLNQKILNNQFSFSTQINFVVFFSLQIIIFLSSYILFLLGWWLPIIPATISVGVNFLVWPAYKSYEWQHLAHVDKLTKVANRGYFDKYLGDIWQQGNTNRQYVSLILCDIDYFKYYNDTYGHPKGDVCLEKVANSIKITLRTTDLVARYGGEEFVIVLPNTNTETAIKIAERIRKNVQSLQISHESSQANMYVTLSCGVATTNPKQDGLSPEDLIKKADVALYQAKKDGRNRVVVS